MKDVKDQLISALLFILTVAAVSCAVVNLRQQSIYHQPDDGVIWVDRTGSQPSENKVVARDVRPDGPGDKFGIRPGDILIGIGGYKIQDEKNVPQALERVKSGFNADYLVIREGVEVTIHGVVIGEIVPDGAIYYQYAVGFFYLCIGLFVYYRRVGAPRAVHFYVMCLASFVLYTFHYTRKLNIFDQVIYVGNVVAWLLVPAIFLHFCLVYPERRKWLRKPVFVGVIYIPAVILLTVHVLAQYVAEIRVHQFRLPLIEVREFLDRVELGYMMLMYLLGAIALSLQFRKVEDAVVVRQLKYLRNGTIVGVLPFAAIYVIPFILGAQPSHYQSLSVLSMALIPITWAYAILRYRLMDVDIIFQQGYVYSLATLAVIGIFYGLIISFAHPDTLSPIMVVGLILFATFIFQPIRNWIQEQLDRYFFYKDRYDYRRTLIEFGRELSSETNMDAMLGAVGDRMVHTLSIQHVAFFLARENEDTFDLHTTMGQRKHGPPPADPDLSFLSKSPDKPYLFFERTRHLLDVAAKEWPASVRSTITELDLTYYFPCSVRGRTIAYLGLSRTDKGDFLSSDDVELLITLSGYVAIAIENARLYRSLQRKVEEYERLKDFSENIVESINVGILAADLEDRVESWNSQIERLTGIARDAAVGRRLSELFPADLVEILNQVRGQTGVHNIYKFVLEPLATSNGNCNHHGNGAPHQPASHTLNLAIAPLVSKDLEQIGRLVIFDDVTDRDELERRLVQADKLSSIGLLAAGVAHEVNTPLAVISTYAQMLAKQISGDDQKSKLLEKIAKQTFRASEIVNSLLNFSRTSTTDFVETDLNRVIRETLTLIEHQLQKASVDVQVQLDTSLPPIKGNAGKLQQVFLNLFLNARDAMDRGGILAVRTSTENSMVRIEIADTGQGIAPENLARIYDPFFTTKAARKGTGLGLSVTYGIVREHGGTIEVESEPGAGTRFQVELPLVAKMAHA